MEILWIWILLGIVLIFIIIAIVLLLFVSVLIYSTESPRQNGPQMIFADDDDISGGVVTNIRQLKYRLWPDDPQCRHHVVQFIKNCDRPLMALASYPGSGNTFVRGVIERLTGYFTGSVYTDSLLFTKGSFVLYLN